jgi:glycosyltransferase involved in cell wall biosynthesis
MAPDAGPANRAAGDDAKARNVPLLVADGDIPTTQLIERVLRAAHGSVETRYPETLFGADVDRRHLAFSRFCLPTHRWLPDYLAARRLGYLYVLDDHLWAVTDAVDPHLAAFYSHPEALATLDAFVRGARAAVVMSKRLGQVIAERLPGTRVEYLNPPFDTERANALLAAEAARAPRDDIVRIGYPTSRRPGVAALLVPVVRHVAQRYGGRAIVEFVGWMPDELVGVDGVTLLPHVGDYDDYLAFKIGRHWDIGLAPLAGGTFDACKTSVKYREYGGCRIAGVYGNVPPYTDDVAAGRTGVLADHRVDAWIAALERLIESPELRDALGGRAHADVEARFSQRASVARWREIAGAHANVA